MFANNSLTLGKKEVIVAAMLTAVAVSVSAGNGGQEFTEVYDMLVDWSTGTLGKIIALAALIVGIGFGLVRQSVIAAVIGVSMALVLNFGPTVIDGILVATADASHAQSISLMTNGLNGLGSALGL